MEYNVEKSTIASTIKAISQLPRLIRSCWPDFLDSFYGVTNQEWTTQAGKYKHNSQAETHQISRVIDFRNIARRWVLSLSSLKQNNRNREIRCGTHMEYGGRESID